MANKFQRPFQGQRPALMPAWANRFKGLKARASPSALKMLGTGLQPFRLCATVPGPLAQAGMAMHLWRC